MNTKSISDHLKIFVAVLITAILVTILMSTGLATTIKDASTNLSSFLPVTLKNPSFATQTSSGVLIVFSSLTTTDGNAGGRTGMDNICTNEDPESHLCSLIEIETAWTTRGIRFQDPFTKAWVDNPMLGTLIQHQTENNYKSDWINGSCMGWTSNSDSIQGTWIDDNGSSVYIRDQYGPICSQVHPVTCCKSAP